MTRSTSSLSMFSPDQVALSLSPDSDQPADTQAAPLRSRDRDISRREEATETKTIRDASYCNGALELLGRNAICQYSPIPCEP